MKNYAKTASWAILAALMGFFLFRSLELLRNSYLPVQWELCIIGSAFLLFSGITQMFMLGGHKQNKELGGYAYDIPILTTALVLYLLGILISLLNEDPIGALVNFLLFILPVIFIGRTMISMALHYTTETALGQRTPSLGIGRLGTLFGYVFLQTVVGLIAFIALMIGFSLLNFGMYY